MEAIAHRLRRVYLPLITVLLGAWVVRVTAFADVPFPASAAIGQLPGIVVTALVILSYGVMFFVALRPRTWNIEGELLKEDLREE